MDIFSNFTTENWIDISGIIVPIVLTALTALVVWLRSRYKKQVPKIEADKTHSNNDSTSQNIDEIKRSKDIDTINLFFKNISIGGLNRNIEQHENRVISMNDVLYLSFIESGLDDFSNSQPVIHNKKLDKKLLHFYTCFHDFLSFASENFSSSGGNNILSFPSPSSFPKYEEYAKADAILKSKSLDVRRSFVDLIAYLRKKYIEVDIDVISNKAELSFSKYLESI